MIQTILITGAGGQLGRELLGAAPAAAHCVAVTHSELNIGDGDAVARLMAEVQPTLVINAAAYTAVDAAETETGQAALGNHLGPANLATQCRQRSTRMIHLSTDFVFDGTASRPYTPASKPAPVSEYGRSKLAGEQAVLAQLPNALIIRTGWVYSRFGKNFVKTMLGLMAQREQLNVVADQIGTPTWARGLAEAIWQAAAKPELNGIYHWSDAGVCSWYDFAQAIQEEAAVLELLSGATEVLPIPASQYPTPAQRPYYSVLDKRASWRDFGCEARHWRVQLRSMLRDLKDNSA